MGAGSSARERASALRSHASSAMDSSQLELQARNALIRARTLLDQGDRESARDAAVLASTLALKICERKAPKQAKKAAAQLFEEAASLAEQIKKSKTQSTPLRPTSLVTPTSPMPIESKLKFGLDLSSLSPSERKILLQSSRVNNSVFIPWSVTPSQFPSADSKFSDSDGFLSLSPGQQGLFDSWKRPEEIWGSQVTLFGTGSADISQDILSDCSVIASLCVIADLEQRSGHSLIAQILQCRSTSRTGEYNLKLFFNGTYRRVTIDDYVPTSKASRYIHVVSRSNPGLLWPILIEKAYLKVMGGYDFPGSNAASDLFALTAWIPEHILLHDENVKFSSLWERIHMAWGFGDVLISAGTGKLVAEEENLYGLVSEHDYAVLDVRELADKTRAVLVKNPWHIYNETVLDALSCSIPAPAGCFWMAFSRFCVRFNSLYLNWNPNLFKYQEQAHFRWDLASGLSERSIYTSPQYAVENLDSSEAKIWILLTRHFKMKHDQKFYIALHVYNEPGVRVWTRKSTTAKSMFVDSHQAIIRFELPARTAYTVVVAAQGGAVELHSFSMFAYSVSRIRFASAVEAYPLKVDVSGEWTELSCGGNTASPSYLANPQYKLSVLEDCDLQIYAETAVDSPIFVQLLWGNGMRISTVQSRDVLLDSGEYTVGCAVTKRKAVQRGDYTIVVSLYQPGVMGSFDIHLASTLSCTLVRLPDLSLNANRC
ncbi:uncharacterized protein V1518DRAFT_409365 [Limtongia smithiae]|uniref:uncharacterized protein n=1 Tax=Limtongia smithiae TaxID=1125753 RepID=UPI0034CE16EF